tara:strand:- start:309 stop:1094 length:786 start_codon:yes stop_codon:yes gene_type:complete
MGGIYKSTELVALMHEIRDDLSKEFPFNKSNPMTYSFRRNELTKNGLDSHLGDILYAVGYSKIAAKKALKSFESFSLGGTCFYADKSYHNFDYIIAVFWPPGSDFALEHILTEEIMHGEHYIKQSKQGIPYNLFSRIAQEFFGGLGSSHLSSKVKTGAIKPFLLPSKYDEAKDFVWIDPPHLIGYQLAEQAYGTLPCSELFEISDEKELWERFNDGLIPDIKIPVPLQWNGDGDELISIFQNNLLELGLKTDVKLDRYNPT